MEDLSKLAAKSLATDSMHAGNQVWDRSSMSAPGGDSGDEQNMKTHDAPTVEMQPAHKVGTDGKKQARGEDWSPPGPPRWISTAH